MYCIYIIKNKENICVKQLYDVDEYIEFIDGMLVLLNCLNIKHTYKEYFDEIKSLTNLYIEII